MTTLPAAKTILEMHKPKLRKEFGVNKIGVFGSLVRNENKKNSDIDILVDFSRPIGLFKFMDLEEYLSRVLAGRIDLVSKGSLRGHIGKNVLKEVVYI